MMTVSEIMQKMLAFSNGNLHDINHLLKVWGYARTIGCSEGLDEETQFILEVSAIVHDIACPLCREKYGNTDGKLQEKEGMPLARAFLADTGLSPAQIDRAVYLVGHHHTVTGVDGSDYQILLEADYLVNAFEEPYSPANIANAKERLFRTRTGRQMLSDIYGV